MIHILYTFIQEDNQYYLSHKYFQLFPITFQKKLKRFRNPNDAQLSLLGRLLLYEGINKYYYADQSFDIHYSTHHKPYFLENKVKFNISHSGNIAVCAITGLSEIGIDIEKIKNQPIEDFKPHMTELEWKRICGSETKQKTFFHYWTEKEAILKAHGKGLAIPLNSFDVQGDTCIVEGKKYFIKKILIHQNYVCHVALQHKIHPEKIKINAIKF